MKILKVEIKLGYNWTDISSNVDTKQNVRLVTRCDEAFATGSLIAWLDRKTNIPPYTPLRITYHNHEKDIFCCSSTCKRHLNLKNVYVHEIQLLDKSAWMSCWILGSKNFSSQTAWPEDWKKMYKIYAIMTEKYGVTYSRNGWDDKFTQNQEFTFGPGTTMYDAYVQMMGTYNCKPIIEEWNPDTNSFIIGYKDLSAATKFDIEEKYILFDEMRQDVDTYGNLLEVEAGNVIDRDTPMLVTGLTPRWDSIQMNADNNKLILPTRIEKVNKFKVSIPGGAMVDFFNIPSSYFWRYKNNSGELDFGEINDHYKSLKTWIYNLLPEGETSIDNSPFTLLVKQMVENNQEFTISDIFNWIYYPADNGNGTVTLLSGGEYLIDITDKILEEQQYNCLEAKDKPKYCFYKSGENYIDGLNLRYKDDFWNAILGNREESFLKQINISSYDKQRTYTSGDITLTLYVGGGRKLDVLENTFDVEYIPIVDMMMIKNKEVTPLNEVDYKTISRSYSNGSNFIDFNRLDFALQKSNDFLGLEEYSIEYSLKNVSDPPVPGQFIIYDNVQWYIASCDRTLSKDNDVVVMNLVRDYNKVADVIGVKTQFESTKLPLNNIIDRHIYHEDTQKCALTKDIYVKFVANGRTLFKELLY